MSTPEHLCETDKLLSPADSLVGKLLDNRIELMELLARGASSSVYKARHHWQSANFIDDYQVDG